ncbi:MAG: tRNA preQ1(34) S-adenosylmethionine ribosyltransferase-isomerase QueA [Pseudomonadota bacterium]
MKVSDFNFDLSEELIAQKPLAERSASRLLALNRETGEYQDRMFTDLVDILEPGDLLVFNNTRVIPARLFAEKETGGKVEVLIERVLDEGRALAQIKANRKPQPGTVLMIDGRIDKRLQRVEVQGRENEFWRLRLLDAVEQSSNWLDVLHESGHVPLPPYIQRDQASGDLPEDEDRYQTVYAEVAGAVAAPTAGLHFDRALFDRLDAKDIGRAFCTLHVGAGTFQPVRVDEVEDHTMHPEWLHVDQMLVETIQAAKTAGKRVVAVGTTSVRALETAAADGALKPMTGESRLFIYPGYQFNVIDAMITNFHLPGSTLMMLISAFADREHVLNAYQHAIEQRYRFFSYGDAMYIA